MLRDNALEGKTIVVSGDWSKISEYRDSFDSNFIHYDI